MCDQLRFDYLGCTGHPTIKTPNIDALAADGVRFSQAYVQSTICGPSRMSAYTGRYVRSHGATTNESPLRVGEPTLGDHLNGLGVDAVLIGKTHMVADLAGMARLGLSTSSLIGVRTSECGFLPYVRDDGLHPDPIGDEPDYFAFLRQNGLEADNPWESWANAAEDDDGSIVSGWFMRHAGKPARVPAHLSESSYITDRTLDFMKQADKDRPWVAHVSYIKPHWPYIAPAPYHNMYDSDDVVDPQRSDSERDDGHPVYQSFRNERYSKAFSRDEVRETVIPTYMGLISQIDDEMGRIVAHLKASDQYDNTMIIFTSDHGDYLGDHWLGEKQMFHDPSVRIPLIIRDPRKEADVTRSTVCDDLVEMIDIAPTLIECYGGEVDHNTLEGRSLLPLLRRLSPAWRNHVFSEYHYTDDRAMWELGHEPRDCIIRMVADREWKLVQFESAEPILFHKAADPNELVNRAKDPDCQTKLTELMDALFVWARNPANNICVSEQSMRDAAQVNSLFDCNARHGYLMGYWDEAELAEEEKKFPTKE